MVQRLRRTASEEGHRPANSLGRRWDPSGAKEEPLRLKPTKQGLQPDGIGNYYSNEDLLEDYRLQLT